MRTTNCLIGSAAFLLLALSGCGGDDRPPPPSFTTQILTDPSYDGDIAAGTDGSFVVTQGMNSSVQSVFAGIDPATSSEYRAFLDFPLGGSGGVPGSAIIESAFLDIYVNSLQPASGSLPLRIELVAFQPPTLLPTDYDLNQQPALAFIQVSPDFVQSDVGTNVTIDVTSLMVQAQISGVTDFQVRVLEDLGPAIPVLLEINDSTGSDRSARAPVLTVTYQ